MSIPRRLVLGFALLCITAHASVATADPVSAHVRPLDPMIARALSHGYADSPTFRALVARIDGSNVIVQIAQRDDVRACDGETQLLGAAGGYRYLLVTIRTHVPGRALVGLLAHELQHVAEIADARWVHDERSVRALYERIGETRGTCPTHAACFETSDAIAIGYRVLREMDRAASGLAGVNAALTGSAGTAAAR